jgi:hypothetical protein
MKMKDKAKLRRILYNKYWFIKLLDNSNIFSHLVVIITVLLQYTILFIEYEPFMRSLIYVSMVITSLMLIAFYIWLIVSFFIQIIKLYEYIKFYVIKIKTIIKNYIEKNKNKKNGNNK